MREEWRWSSGRRRATARSNREETAAEDLRRQRARRRSAGESCERRGVRVEEAKLWGHGADRWLLIRSAMV